MTIEDIIASLEDQAQDKDRLAGGDPDSIFAADATVLIEAAKILRGLTAPPTNESLTLEELREMDGEPVFVAMSAFGCSGHWGIVHNGWVRFGDGDSTPIKKIVRSAYRRKPEKGTTCTPTTE